MDVDQTTDPEFRSAKFLAFQAAFKMLWAKPGQTSLSSDYDATEKYWWRLIKQAGWISPKIWAAAVVEADKTCTYRPQWAEMYGICEYVKSMLEGEGTDSYLEAQVQRAERAETGVDNRPSPPRLPAPEETPTKREVRRATILRHAAVARATMKRRRRLTAAYAAKHGLSLGHCAIPEEAWKGLDEPTPEEITTELEATPPERTVGALYRALRPGERAPIRVTWVKADGTALEDENGRVEDAYFVPIGPPDPPSPATVKEREKVMAKEPVVKPYNEAQFKRDHPGQESVASPGHYAWPHVPRQED